MPSTPITHHPIPSRFEQPVETPQRRHGLLDRSARHKQEPNASVIASRLFAQGPLRTSHLRMVKQGTTSPADPGNCCIASSAGITTGDAPRITKSLIRNWPTSPKTGKPYFSYAAPGVENRKLTVSRNVTTAPKLPTNERPWGERTKRNEDRDRDLNGPNQVGNSLHVQHTVYPRHEWAMCD